MRVDTKIRYGLDLHAEVTDVHPYKEVKIRLVRTSTGESLGWAIFSRSDALELATAITEAVT